MRASVRSAGFVGGDAILKILQRGKRLRPVQAIRLPMAESIPLTMESPRRIAPSSSIVQSHSECSTEIGRTDDAVRLGIANERGTAVKAHRLIVEQGAIEFRGAMHFQPATRIGDEGKADRVALGKAIDGERLHGLDDLFRHLGS